MYLQLHLHTTFFCYSAVAHILTASVNVAYRPKLGFKNKCRARAGFGAGSGFKMRPFSNSVWACRQGPTRGDWEPTNSKNRLKSFCEVGYIKFRPNIFVAGKTISMKILGGVGLHEWCPVALKIFVAFSNNGNVQKNIYRLCNIKRLEQYIKSRCNLHLWNAWKLKCSTVRMACPCDQRDSAFGHSNWQL